MMTTNFVNVSNDGFYNMKLAKTSLVRRLKVLRAQVTKSAAGCSIYALQQLDQFSDRNFIN